MFCFYRPQTNFGQGNVFTGVCLFTGGMPGPRSLLGDGYVKWSNVQDVGIPECWGACIPEGRGGQVYQYTRGVDIGRVYIPIPLDMGPAIPTVPPVVTPSDGHHNTYSWQAVRMLLECFLIESAKVQRAICSAETPESKTFGELDDVVDTRKAFYTLNKAKLGNHTLSTIISCG